MFNHRQKETIKFKKFWNTRLEKNCRDIWINSYSQIIKKNVINVLVYSFRILIIVSISMDIGQNNICVIFVLELYPVFQRTNVMTNMQLASRSISRQNSLFHIIFKL